MNSLLANLHQSLQGKDIGIEGAKVITRVLIQQIEEAEGRFEPQSSAWETDVIAALRLCKGVHTGSETAQIYVLSLIDKHWDELSIDFRKEYDYQFDVLVMRETNVQPSTMDNYIRAADTFFVKKKKPLGKIEVPVYDQYRKPVKKDGEVVKQLVDFDPGDIPITKLHLARSLAENDKMTPKLWSMLADKEVTADALKKEIYSPAGTDNNGKSVDPSLRFKLYADRIVAREFDEEVEIAEIYFDNIRTDLGRAAIRRMLIMLQIPFEEDQIAQQIQQARDTMILRVYDNGGDKLINDNDN